MKKFRDILGIIMALLIALACIAVIVLSALYFLTQPSLESLIAVVASIFFFGIMFLRGTILAIRDCIRKNF